MTEKELHFFMFLPESHLCVPLEAISEVTITKKHLGKATLNDLLKVQFVAEGKMDSVAWYLADPRAWQARLESLRGGGVTLGVKG